jgi:zinc/manganese transport system substrate-binding protein
MKRLVFAVMSLVVGAILTLPGVAAAADRIKAVATFSVIADMVANVAGDTVDLVTIVGPDGDCEEYEPTAADVPKMADARILFMNGLNDDFEPWLPNLMQQAKFSGTKVIVTRGVKAITAEDEHPMGGKPKATKLDQHAWMLPHNSIVYVKNITDTLARVDPAHADIYRNRAASYTQQLRELDSWAHAEMAAVPTTKRRVLSSHDSLQYLGTTFGITIISVHGLSNNSEPSAAELTRVTDQIRREHLKALFLDSITDPRPTEQISKESGAAIAGTIYGDALSKPDGVARSYIEMIRHDISTLKAGMLLN